MDCAPPTLYILGASDSRWLFSCVTVNVNIPDSAVQQATDDYVKDLYEAKAKSKPAKPVTFPVDATPCSIEIIPSGSTPKTDTVRPTARRLIDISDRLKSRLADISALKRPRESSAKATTANSHQRKDQKGATKSRVWKLMNDENGDRFELYHEVVAHNGMNKGNLETIARNFAHSFQKHSPSGTWVQDDAGAWSKP